MQNQIENLKADIAGIEACIEVLTKAQEDGQLRFEFTYGAVADLHISRVARILALRALERNAQRQ